MNDDICRQDAIYTIIRKDSPLKIQPLLMSMLAVSEEIPLMDTKITIKITL